MITVDGDVTFDAAGSLTAELNGPTPASLYDQLQVTGAGRTVSLNGVTLDELVALRAAMVGDVEAAVEVEVREIEAGDEAGVAE